MLIPYLGEKSKFANFIIPNIPKDISTYVEPFGGMFGIFFALNFEKYQDVKFIYNDQNKLNHLLFNKLREVEFIDLVKSTKVDEEFYKSCFKYLVTETDENTLALYWLIILCCSSPYEVEKPSWRGSSEFEIFKMKYSAYKYHLNKINQINNLDYKEIIKMYDSKDTFFYIDPPYFGKEKFYINHTFTQESHKELSEVLNNIQGRFLLSYYQFDGMEDLYPDCQIKSLMTIMGTEFLIMNY
jgi:DNA adenine methylase